MYSYIPYSLKVIWKIIIIIIIIIVGKKKKLLFRFSYIILWTCALNTNKANESGVTRTGEVISITKVKNVKSVNITNNSKVINKYEV